MGVSDWPIVMAHDALRINYFKPYPYLNKNVGVIIRNSGTLLNLVGD